MKPSTCSARAITREGTVKNAAIKLITQKAQANYSHATQSAAPPPEEQVIVIIKLEGDQRLELLRHAGPR